MVTVPLNFPSPPRWQHDYENIGRCVDHRLHPRHTLRVEGKR